MTRGRRVDGVKTAFSSRRRRRCSAESMCVFGGRIRPGDRVVRSAQHHYVHEVDLDSITKAFDVLISIDARAFAAAVTSAMEAFVAMFRELGQQLQESVAFVGRAMSMPDAHPMDADPDRCWRCDAKPGMDELDGACWRCHYDLTGRKPTPLPP